MEINATCMKHNLVYIIQYSIYREKVKASHGSMLDIESKQF